MDYLGNKVDKLQIRDQKLRKTPYKPQMTPKRCRGGGQRQTDTHDDVETEMTIDQDKTTDFEGTSESRTSRQRPGMV